jgi:valyl-tRNA synthetase
VHPEDERYRHLAGKQVRLPITNRLVPIVADSYVDPQFGSGCLKITPGHDFNDYEIGKRHELPLLNILDRDAKIVSDPAASLAAIPAALQGLDRFVARERVVALLEAQGFIEKIEPHTLPVPRGDRSDAVLEPWLTDQWYVRIAPLADAAVRAVADARVRFVPANWEKT